MHASMAVLIAAVATVIPVGDAPNPDCFSTEQVEFVVSVPNSVEFTLYNYVARDDDGYYSPATDLNGVGYPAEGGHFSVVGEQTTTDLLGGSDGVLYSAATAPGAYVLEGIAPPVGPTPVPFSALASQEWALSNEYTWEGYGSSQVQQWTLALPAPNSVHAYACEGWVFSPPAVIVGRSARLTDADWYRPDAPAGALVPPTIAYGPGSGWQGETFYLDCQVQPRSSTYGQATIELEGPGLISSVLVDGQPVDHPEQGLDFSQFAPGSEHSVIVDFAYTAGGPYSLTLTTDFGELHTDQTDINTSEVQCPPSPGEEDEDPDPTPVPEPQIADTGASAVGMLLVGFALAGIGALLVALPRARFRNS